MAYKTKVCERCGKEYTSNVHNQKYCIDCAKEVRKEYDRKRNKTTKRKEAKKQYNIKNRDKIQEYRKQYYKQNKEKLNADCKKWREQNKEYLKEYERKRNQTEKRKEYEKNRSKDPKRIQYNKEYNKKYNKENRDKLNKYRRNKYHSNLNFKLADWGRKQVKRCLKYISTDKTKDKHTFDILGYTTQQLKQRLEMNFKPDMNWENHDILWHIDHKKALKHFNFTLPDGTPDYKQIRLANSLANLTPMYKTDNLSKGSKSTKEFYNII